MKSELLTLAQRFDRSSDEANRLAASFAAIGMVSAEMNSNLQAANYADTAARLREIAFDLVR